MSRMRRLMVEPMNWGTQSGSPWDPTAQVIQPHTDYVQQYTLDHSIRIWEPGRQGLSEPALFQMAPGYQGQGPATAGAFGALVNPDAVAVTIHGIKGDIFLEMANVPFTAGGDQPNAFGEWTDPTTGAVIPVIEYETRKALGGAGKYPGQSVKTMPFFICMYRGTYKQLDDQSGWEIDSGPADDPDTLLGLDISAPSVLEDPRMDWWTHVDVPFPVWNIEVGDGSAGYSAAPTAFRAPLRVPMNLEANKRLGPNQVLWLHVRTGVVQAWVTPTGEPATTLVPANYRNHDFLFSSKMSMLVTLRE